MGDPFPFLFRIFIKVNQTSRQQNFLLRLGHILEIQLKLPAAAVRSDDGCLKFLCTVLDCLADARQVYILASLQIDLLLIACKRQDAPVNAVAAVTLGCVLDTDISQTKKDSIIRWRQKKDFWARNVR